MPVLFVIQTDVEKWYGNDPFGGRLPSPRHTAVPKMALSEYQFLGVAVYRPVYRAPPKGGRLHRYA